jgi:hypothetical protein
MKTTATATRRLRVRVIALRGARRVEPWLGA